MAQLPPCLVGIEACGGSHHWGLTLSKMGHTVKLMNPQFVKPYVKSNKNDSHDTEAICEAVTRPNMRFVAIKNIEQQDIQAIHRIRERLVHNRTALINQIRGLLAEYGIIIPQGVSYVRKELPIILEDGENDLLLQLNELDKKVELYDKKIELICKNNEPCQRLIQVEGVGSVTATAIIASMGDATVFKNGREVV